MKKTLLLLVLLTTIIPATASAEGPMVTIAGSDATSPQNISTLLQLLFALTVLSLAPAIVLMTTCFTRIVIVLSFVKQAVGTQQAPPAQIIIGLALFLTFFIMAPIADQINNTALQPYLQNTVSKEDAINNAVQPLRQFMFKQASEKDLGLLMEIAGRPAPANKDEIPTLTLIPAFMLSELRYAFQMGFMLYIPFLVVDMIVASVLMSMGMMMLPPVIISAPFKILLFVLVDGWGLVIGSLVKSFY